MGVDYEDVDSKPSASCKEDSNEDSTFFNFGRNIEFVEAEIPIPSPSHDGMSSSHPKESDAPSGKTGSEQEEDSDRHFLLSLLPHLQTLSTSEKLHFQIGTLNLINKIIGERHNSELIVNV